MDGLPVDGGGSGTEGLSQDRTFSDAEDDGDNRRRVRDLILGPDSDSDTDSDHASEKGGDRNRKRRETSEEEEDSVGSNSEGEGKSLDGSSSSSEEEDNGLEELISGGGGGSSKFDLLDKAHQADLVNSTIPHLFLPKRTPDTADPELAKTERFLLRSISHSISDLVEELNFTQLDPLVKMLSLWDLLQPTSSNEEEEARFIDNYVRAVNSLRGDTTLPIYVRKQNCTLLIEKPSGSISEFFRVETYRSALPSEVVMSNVAALSMEFPEESELVQNQDLLVSPAFARNLYELSVEDFTLSIPIRYKAGQPYGDSRDVPEPFLINEWLLAVLLPPTPTETETTEEEEEEEDAPPKVCKKLRDQVTFTSRERMAPCSPFRRSGIWLSIKVAMHLKLLKIFEDDATANVVYKLLILQVLGSTCESYFNARKVLPLDLDLAQQMLAKLGRRVWKLNKMSPPSQDIPEETEAVKLLLRKVVERVDSLVSNLHQFMLHCQSVPDSESNSILYQLPERSIHQYLADLEHWIPALNSFRLPKPIPTGHQSGAGALTADMWASLAPHRYPTLDSLLLAPPSLPPSHSTHARMWLNATEQFMKCNLKTEEDAIEADSPKILQLVELYITHTTKLYEGNPLGISQVILVVLRAVEVLDRIASGKHWVLRDYRSDINPAVFDHLLLPHKEDMLLLDSTLLYFKGRNKGARNKEGILVQEVRDNSFAPRFVSEHDEMTQFRDEIIREMENRIKAKHSEVHKAIMQCKSIHTQIQSAGPCVCQEEEVTPRSKPGKGSSAKGYIPPAYRHPTTATASVSSQEKCKRCLLEEDLREARQSVKILERPLPTKEHLQNAVIFEILIPPEISHLRECLALLKFGLLDEPAWSFQENQISVEWLEYKNLNEYLEKEGEVVHPQSVVRLESKFFPYSIASKSYLKRNRPDVLTSADDQFVLDNGMTCVYAYEFDGVQKEPVDDKRRKLHTKKRKSFFPPFLPLRDFRKQCSFKITSMAKNEPYLCLQPFLQSWEHSQNEVIAKQSVCHANLGLDEYITYGSTRAGHRLQFRNLYRGIATKVLSLDEEPVLALIMQSCWQLGPQKGLEGERDAHCDLEDNVFASAFLELMWSLVEGNLANYSRPLILFGAVIITGRIMELNWNLFEKGLRVLTNVRQILHEWTRKLDFELKKDYEEAYQNELRRSQILTWITIAFTYNFSSSVQWERILPRREDLMLWLLTLATLNEVDEGLLSSTGMSGFMRHLLQASKQISLRLKLEESIRTEPALVDSLHMFVWEKWGRAVELMRGNTEVVMGYPNLVRLTYKGMDSSSSSGEDDLESNSSDGNSLEKTSIFCITFDMVLGTFLVNGFPQSYLPSYFTKATPFRRFFGRNTKLRVQRESEMMARTIKKFHGRLYEFILNSKPEPGDKDAGGTVTISEITQAEGEELKLILLPHELFKGHLAISFVENFTHWLDPGKNVIYLRRLPKQDSDYDLPHEYKMVRVEGGEKWRLYDERSHAYLLSVKSDGFEQISEALAGLEMSRDINVVMEENGGNLTAQLPRYGLRFLVKGEVLECVEYPGYLLVDLEQPSGTLLGLQSGVQLKCGERRVLVVPHGKILTVDGVEEELEGDSDSECSGAGEGEQGEEEEEEDQEVGKVTASTQQRTRILIEQELYQPPYFLYQFDPVLKRLVANKSKSAWLYLAALHGVTSSYLPDPFTQVTGTEMAVRILQSGFVWSGSPYDEDSRRILEFLRGLSPTRTYFGHKFVVREGQKDPDKVFRGSMELVGWPQGLPSMAAYDGYEIIVEKLIEDSERLSVLYRAGEEKEKEEESRMDGSSARLRMRGYLHHLGSYNPSVAVEQRYFGEGMMLAATWTAESPVRFTGTKTSNLHLGAVLSMVATRMAGMEVKSKSFRKNNLVQWLFASFEPQSEVDECAPQGLNDVFNADFKRSWIHLYEMAGNAAELRGKEREEARQEFTMVLCGMAYKGAPLTQVVNLHYMFEMASRAQFPMAPMLFPEKLEEVGEDELEGRLEAILMKHVDWEGAWTCRDALDMPRQVFERQLEKQVGLVAKGLKRKYWPCEKLDENDSEMLEMLSNGWISYVEALEELNEKLKVWYWSREAKKFAEEVEMELEKIYNSIPKTDKNSSCKTEERSTSVSLGKVELEYWEELSSVEELLQEDQLNQRLLTQAGKYFKTGKPTGLALQGGAGAGDSDNLLQQREAYRKKAGAILASLEDALPKLLRDAGLCPRLDPTTLLKTLLVHNGEDQNQQEQDPLRIYAGGLAVLWTHLKRLNRLLAYQAGGQELELQQELENRGHQNWSPSQCPAWLLLQLDLDIMIRPVQVLVARQMLQMPDGRNGVMQLNMGEGKTSVIVPMLCSLIAQPDSLCRVTVLGSMFNMNRDILSFAVGGLLGKRVYTFPCRRDMPLGEKDLLQIQAGYEECLEMLGVVLTLPEHRLSFRQLAYDHILKRKAGLGLALLKTENWLRAHVRDVLDESDELLNVKYQLVYTIGGQLPLDGGPLRWVTCQRLLKVVQDIAKQFLLEFGGSVMELDLKGSEENPHEFPCVRLLDPSYFQEFIGRVADVVLEQTMTRSSDREKEKFKHIFTSETIPRGTLEDMMRGFSGMAEALKRVLLISGYLRRGVLTLGLSKRWRVEYGVDPNKHFRRMAVPFRAKDVPAERTEFGHPDLTILLTHLSYYYGGLSDEQLDSAMQMLKGKQGAAQVYEGWIKQVPQGRLPPYLRSFHDLNLKDSHQRGQLFHLLRRHKLVVDFWLGNKVFPVEAKQFPRKLVMTSWDLCYERQVRPVTGFSGTNDSSVLLPLQISQQDLEELQGTNERMEGILLQPQNNQGHRGFGMGVTCRVILERMRQDELRVLIDAGALMLECDNEQVAELWLEVDQGVEAVVYFNAGNELMVKVRRGRREGENKDIPFELSSFQGRLDKCGVFLDDQHTRGTDLKLPQGSRGCVTVGGRMKRDKLIQACMRMRKLGQGHSVRFYLSHEALDKVMRGKHSQGSIGTRDLLEWARRNTRDFNEDGLLYWAIAGKNYAQRLAAEDNFYWPKTCHGFNWAEAEEDPSKWMDGKGLLLAEQCVDEEATSLAELYGQHAEVSLLARIIPGWFRKAMDRLTKNNSRTQLTNEAVMNFSRIGRQILERCRSVAPDKTHFSGWNSFSLEEEQEKELELEKEAEVEQEKVVERRDSRPDVPLLHDNVKRVVVEGDKVKVMEGIMRLCDVFMDTTFWQEVQPEGWGKEVYATSDFISVIADKYFRTDHFIRPVEYFVTQKTEGGKLKLLLLSPHEVNELLPLFWRGQVKAQLHIYSIRRSEKQPVLVNNPMLMLPRKGSYILVAENSRANAALLLASANLYFRSMEEQKTFAKFLSLAPQPWTAEQRRLSQLGGITKGGFVLPQARRGGNGEGDVGFSKDPTGLVKKILLDRHPVLAEMAHIVRLVNEKRFVPLTGGN